MVLNSKKLEHTRQCYLKAVVEKERLFHLAFINMASQICAERKLDRKVLRDLRRDACRVHKQTIKNILK